MMKGVIAGLIAGIAGAAVWAIVAAVTGFEIGWLAWGIGAAVGAGVAWGSDGTPVTGVIAVVISLLAIVVGKYITVEIVLAKEVDSANEMIAQYLEDEEYMIRCLSEGIIYEMTEQGHTINWPAGVTAGSASEKKDYPTEIWGTAEAVWAQMSDDEKDEFRDSVADEINANMAGLTISAKKEGFLASFSPMDAIFFLLAIATAYKVGSKAD